MSSTAAGMLKMSELAEQSGVSAGTIKHYLREGLLGDGGEVVRTSRNMAYYPADYVERIRLIKRLQEERFMPLRVIREVMDTDPERAAMMIELEDRLLDRAIAAREGSRVSRAQVRREYDVPQNVLRRLEELGVLTPNSRGYDADDVKIIEAMSRFRAGGYDEALGFTVYDTLRYREALEPLVEEEVRVLLDRLAGEVEVDRAVEIIASGAEPLRDLVGAMHSKLLLAALRRQRGLDRRRPRAATSGRRAPPSRRSPRRARSRPAAPRRRSRRAGGSELRTSTRFSSLLAHRLGLKMQRAAVGDAHAREVLGERARRRPRPGRPSIQTVRSLHCGGSLTPADEVPGQPAAVRGPGPRPPTSARSCGARSRRRCRRSRRGVDGMDGPVDADAAAHGHAALLARPGVPVAAAAHRLDAGGLLEREVDLDAARRAPAPGRARAGPYRARSSCARPGARPAVPDGPERLPRRPDPHRGRGRASARARRRRRSARP